MCDILFQSRSTFEIIISLHNGYEVVRPTFTAKYVHNVRTGANRFLVTCVKTIKNYYSLCIHNVIIT